MRRIAIRLALIVMASALGPTHAGAAGPSRNINTYVLFAYDELVFYLLTVAGLFVLARRTGVRPRGVLYPWLQVAYLVAVALLVADLLVTKPAYTWGSLAVVASGLPFYAYWRRRIT